MTAFYCFSGSSNTHEALESARTISLSSKKEVCIRLASLISFLSTFLKSSFEQFACSE